MNHLLRRPSTARHLLPLLLLCTLGNQLRAAPQAQATAPAAQVQTNDDEDDMGDAPAAGTEAGAETLWLGPSTPRARRPQRLQQAALPWPMATMQRQLCRLGAARYRRRLDALTPPAPDDALFTRLLL